MVRAPHPHPSLAFSTPHLLFLVPLPIHNVARSDLFLFFFFFFITLEPAIEWYKSLYALNASPPRGLTIGTRLLSQTATITRRGSEGSSQIKLEASRHEYLEPSSAAHLEASTGRADRRLLAV